MRNSVAIGMVLLAASPAWGDDWPAFGRDARLTRTPSETISSPAFLWQADTLSLSAASPVAADGFLVTVGRNGTVRAWREEDGSLAWAANPGSPFVSTPVIDRGRVYVPGTEGMLYVYRLADGVLVGTAITGGTDHSSPVMSGDTLYLGSGFPNMHAVALDTLMLTPRWRTSLGQVTYSSPALADGKLVIGCNSGATSALDLATGAIAWTFATEDSAWLSAPMVDGSAVYLVAGTTFRRVDMDRAAWPAANWSLTVTDPLPPASPRFVNWGFSSVAKAGNLLVFMVRFDYYMDDNLDGLADRRVLREFAVAVDPVTKSMAWSVFMAEKQTPNAGGIPPFSLCPTPVANGDNVVCASSLDPSLRLLALVDGSTTASLPLDSACLSSPIIANGRIYALSQAGHLYAFQGRNVPPTRAPTNTLAAASSLTLSWDAVEPGAVYLVRIDDDGEILQNWDFETLVAETSLTYPAPPEGTVLTWSVRVKDAEGAFGPWSGMPSASVPAPAPAPEPIVSEPVATTAPAPTEPAPAPISDPILEPVPAPDPILLTPVPDPTFTPVTEADASESDEESAKKDKSPKDNSKDKTRSPKNKKSKKSPRR